MTWKKLALCTATMLLLAVPSWAGSFGAYGSYWDSNDAGSSWGAGARVGFEFVSWMELEFHGTYFPSFGSDVTGTDIDITATAVDAGLKFSFLPAKSVNPYVGAGASYYFLDADDISLDDASGWYGEAGLDFGGKNTRFFVEAMWRSMNTTASVSSVEEDADFDGITAQVGINWSWGK